MKAAQSAYLLPLCVKIGSLFRVFISLPRWTAFCFILKKCCILRKTTHHCSVNDQQFPLTHKMLHEALQAGLTEIHAKLKSIKQRREGKWFQTTLKISEQNQHSRHPGKGRFGVIFNDAVCVLILCSKQQQNYFAIFFKLDLLLLELISHSLAHCIALYWPSIYLPVVLLLFLNWKM